MINLLSPNDKRQLRAARRNSTWSRYTLFTIIFFVTINLVFGLTFFFIKTQAQTYQNKIDNNAAQGNKNYLTTRKKTETFRKHLTTAKAILDAETNYSSIITNITNTIPSGCVLASLTLSPLSFNTPQTLNFKCKVQADTIRLKTALEHNAALFDKVNIVSTTTSGVADPYPTVISMSLVIKKPTVDVHKPGATP